MLRSVFIFLGLALVAQAQPTEKLVATLVEVESRGDPTLVGDKGKAWGVLQVHLVAVQDVNRIYGSGFTHSQMRDPAVARAVCRMYLAHYATRSRLGRPVTNQDYARIWNGGPDGWKKPVTLSYWYRVKDALRNSPSTTTSMKEIVAESDDAPRPGSTIVEDIAAAFLGAPALE